MVSLNLPNEIWDVILSCVPNSSLSLTAGCIRTIFPSISIHHQFTSIIISNHHQLKPLLAQLTHHPHLIYLPRTFSLTAWRLLDNHLLINLINLVNPNLRAIDLRIGPLFGPDQLEELFLNPKPKLQILSLRFNQNVSKRSCESNHAFLLSQAFTQSLLNLPLLSIPIR